MAAPCAQSPGFTVRDGARVVRRCKRLRVEIDRIPFGCRGGLIGERVRVVIAGACCGLAMPGNEVAVPHRRNGRV